MRVLFATQYGYLAASSRTRVFQYLPFLQARGVETEVVTVLPDAGLAGSQVAVTRHPWRKLRYYLWAGWRTLTCGLRTWWRARACDVLLVQKVVFPAPVRWLLRCRRPPVLFDFDDAIFTTEVRSRHWLAAWKQRRNAAGVPAMLRLADEALVENEYTAEYAAAHCPRVAIITGPIDTTYYRAVEGVARPAGEVVLGWIGSATTLPYLQMIEAPLARLCARFPQARVRVVGADQAVLAGVTLEAKPWSLEEEREDLQGFDIGLMPMPDDPWTRGKGGYKLLQYMALGLPVVTSPVGINRQIVRDGESGYWARTPEEWEDRLAQLIQDADLRRHLGQRGRAEVEATYALSLASERLLEILERRGRERRR